MARPQNWCAYLRVIFVMLVGFAVASPVNAANWFKLRGTEPGGTAHTLQVWGFLQPTWAKDYSDKIEGAVGALAPANGTLPVQGTLPPDRTSQESFSMRRARIGIRGTMLPINNDIDYFMLTEWGENGITRAGGAATLLDASVTFNQLSRGTDDDGLANLGGRIRVGQFLFSQTSQALSQSTPGRRVHVYMPEATFQSAIRRYANDNGRHNWPEDEVPANGARDIGIELFDWAEFKDPIFGGDGPLEFTYSLGVGNGGTIGELNRDDNYRQYYWLSLAKLFDETRGARRHDMMVYGFYQKGDISFNDDIDGDGVSDRTAPLNLNPGNILNPPMVTNVLPTDAANRKNPISCGNRVCKNGNEKDYEQKYYGVGFEYFDKPFDSLGQIRFEAEWQKMKGLIFDGAQSPSAGVNDNAGGFDSILYDDGDFVGGDGKERESEGWYVDVGYDIHQHLGLKNRTTLNLRYDEFDRNKGNKAREANWETWTLTGEYFFHKKARLTATYQFRDASADNRTGGAKTNGNAVLDQVDNRIGLQLTFVFKNVLLR
ncbi:MAG: hypothetical protein WBN57_12650 [Gammaproteobacteria bacterium]